MEKFTQWRDKGTGISPFLPINLSSTQSTPFILSFIYSIFNFILFLIRFPLILITTFIFIIFAPFISSNLKKSWIRTISFLAGIFTLEISIDGLKRNINSLKNGKLSSKLPKGGDIIISNFSSPLDSIVLTSLFDPIFILPDTSGNSFTSHSIIGIIKISLSKPNLPEITSRTTSTTTTNINEFLKESIKKDRPLLIFPEGITSNGRSLLPFNISSSITTFNNNLYKPLLTTIILKYIPGDLTTPLPESFIGWIYRLITTFRIKSKIRISFNERDEKLCQTININSNNEDVEGGSLRWKFISDALAYTGKLRSVDESLNINSKVELINNWNLGRNKNKYKKRY